MGLDKREKEIRLQQAREAHNLWREDLRKERRKRKQLAIEAGIRTKSHGEADVRLGNRWVVEAPETLSLLKEADYSEMMELVHRMRKHVLEDDKRVMLDLSGCKKMKASAVLKLHAELHALNALSPSPDSVTVVWPEEKRFYRFLSKIGFGKFDQQPPPEMHGLLPIRSDVQGDGVVGPLLRKMNYSFYNGSLAIGGEEWDSLHKALSEAILNVQMHAYQHGERAGILEKIGSRWWILGETFEDQLYLVIYDKGIGIPNTILSKEPRVVRVLSRFASVMTLREGGHDSGLIRAAMAYGKSGLKQKGNGLGLFDIRQFVDRNPNGNLRIFSNFGEYRYNSSTRRHTLTEHKHSIHGTLIQWNLSLSTSGSTETGEKHAPSN